MSEEKIKERWKIEDRVFDRRSLLALSKILKKGIIEHIDFPISTGKEANVYRATTPEGEFAAVKMYRIETTDFVQRLEYIEGDPRFHLVKRTQAEIVYAFTKKEFKNLHLAIKAGVDTAQPLFAVKNIVVMSFLGKDGFPYPPLYKVGKEVIEEDFHNIIENVKRLYEGGLVHSDLSEYNILLGDKPYLIDFAQGVALEHPKAHEFLQRDLSNVLEFFKRYLSIDYTLDELYKEVIE